MNYDRFQRNARRRRTKAILYTILLNVAIIGGLLYFTGEDSSILDIVQQWFSEESASVSAETP